MIMAAKKKTKKKSKNPSQKEIDNNLIKRKALEKIIEHNRDYLKCDITIPLGNPALKNVHTNQWLWSNIPNDFNLVNWGIIAKALNADTNRFEAYAKNKWYIESVDVTVNATGKAEMKLGLNAFASTLSKYTEEARSIQKAYTDAVNNQKNKTTKKSSATKTKTNAVTTKPLINEAWVKKYGVPSIVVQKIKQVCKAGKSDEDNVYAWHKWMDANVQWQRYNDSLKSIEQVIRDGKGNCVDNSRVFRAGCLALGVKCTYMQGKGCGGYGHQWNKVYFKNKTVIVDNGRDMASWGSHFGQPCSNGEWETTNSW